MSRVHIIRRALLLVFALFLPLTVGAVKVEINGLWYDIDASVSTAQVIQIQYTSQRYTGDITIPNSVAYLGRNYSVISIGEDAFSDCSGLTSITIPNSVTSIGRNAFTNCTGLTSISLPPSLKSVDNYAFQNCNNLKGVYITDLNAFLRISFGWYAPLLYAHHLYLNGEEVTGEIVFPSDITSVSNMVFEGCTGITSVVIPEGVTSIGQAAFKSCPNLKSVKMPSTLTEIAREAFQDCSGLTSVTIGNTEASIGDMAFSGCTNIVSLGLNGRIINNNFIGNWFSDSKAKITSLTIGESVTSIGSSAFSGCSGLTSVTIPENLTSIGNSAFSGCTRLTSVIINSNAIVSNTYSSSFNLSTVFGNKVKEYVLGENVKTIGNYAFYGSYGLASVTIPNGVTSIGNSAFLGCTGLTSITIGNSVTSIENSAFQNCTRLTSVIINSNAILSNTYSSSSNLSTLFGSQVKEYVLGEDVIIIGNYAFYRCSGLTSVTIGNSVTSIGRSAFYGCTGLTSIDIPNSVTSIGNYAFSSCSGLTSITIPNSVTSIGNYAFYDCTGLTKVVAPDLAAWCGIQFGNTSSNPLYYAKHLYRDENTEITDLVIPNSVTSIGDYAFINCTGLNSVIIPNSVTDIGGSAFYDCSGLTSVTIGNGVTSIGSSAFYMCSGLTSITVASGNTKYDSRNNCNAIIETASNTLVRGCETTVIPNSVTSIGNSAFSGCYSLTSVTIPNGVTSIGGSAFYGCSGLTSVTIPNGVTSIGGSAFYGCSGLISVTIPNGVTSIGGYAFYGCSGLTSVTIPNSVTYIGERAFYDCSGLTSLTIGNSVTSIGGFAFYGCSSLLDVYCLAESVPNCASYTFESIVSKATLHVPLQSIDAYKRFSTWNRFGRIVAIPECVSGSCGDAVTWTYVESMRTLTIQGEGRMQDFNSSSVPWRYYYIENVIIKQGVSSIGNSAFESCKDLTSVTIDNSVTSIGNSAFSSCNKLASITIPNSVISIGDGAFRYCSGLTSVTIGNSVTSIGNEAFRYCSGLTSLNIGYNVSNIGNDVFSMCKNLTSVNINSHFLVSESYSSYFNLTTIFGNQVKELVLGDEVKAIGDYAFTDCYGLTSVTIPNSVARVGNFAFKGCTGLTSVTIPSGVKSIGDGVFSGCTGLTSVIINSNAIVSNTYSSFSNLSTVFGIQMKELVLGDEVKAIGDFAFYSYSGLTSVTIGNSVTNIGGNAFSYCSDLRSIDVPNSVTSIGMDAFSYCTGLRSIDIPNSVTFIGVFAFNGCSGLNKVIVSDIAAWCGIQFGDELSNPLYYAKHLYSDENTEITDLVIPNSVTSIGSFAFSGCSGLTSVTIPNSVTSIGDYAFRGCSGLTSIDIPNSVTSIGYYAFSGCTGLTSIFFPTSVTYIGYHAFEGCTGLTSVAIPSNVKALGNGAFDGCTCLTSVKINSNAITSKNYDFSSNLIGVFGNQVQKIIFGDEVKTIGEYAFCHNILSNNFSSSLTSVTIPSSVNTIGIGAFLGCSSLTSVTIDKQIPIPIDHETFNYRAKATLYVPKGSKAAYEAAANWKDFREIIEIEKNPTSEFDVTYLLLNPGFENGETGWTGFRQGHRVKFGDAPMPVTGGPSYNLCAEALSTDNFDLYQVVENVPVGVYEISVQGFCRNGRDETAWNNYVNQTTYSQPGKFPVYIYLNAKQTPFVNVFSEPRKSGFYTSGKVFSMDGNDYPDDMVSASIAFSAGMYVQKAYGLIAKEGDPLRVGVKGTSAGLGGEDDNWVIFDNFKLTFKGFQTDIIKPFLVDEITKAEEKAKETMGKDAYNALSAAITAAKAAAAGEDGEAMFECLSDLYDAEAAADASIQAFVPLIEALEKLQAEKDIYLDQNPTAAAAAADLYSTIDGRLKNHDIQDSEIEDLINQINAAIKALTDNTTVGIDDISRESVNDGYYYNLNGQRVDVPRKGLYIMNGKKVRR